MIIFNKTFWHRLKSFSVVALLVLFGCGCASEVLLTYSPQENVDELEKARGIGVKIIVNDLREERKIGLRGHNGSSFITIISKENLSDIISNGIQTELIKRGFIAGEKVLIEVDLIVFYSYVIDSLWSNFGAEMVFHIKVRTTEGTRPFQKFISLRENSRTDPYHEEGYKLALEAVLRKGIGVLVNDYYFMNSIIQAGTL